MLISEISIKGLKSFGHNKQIVKLDTDCGKLCLLIGENGAGKSSFITAFEYTTFGKARGRTKKKTPITSLVNRFNNELMTGIKFYAKGKEIEIERGINPDKFVLKVDGVIVPDDESKYNAIIEDYVGMDMLSFRSFISLSINDFKNFTSLPSVEKQLLLDKMFNLQDITEMGSITKDLSRLNKIEIENNKHEIDALTVSINKIDSTIKSIISKKVSTVDCGEEVALLEAKMKDFKPLFDDFKRKLNIITQKNNALIQESSVCKKLYDSVVVDINQVKREISLFDSSKCPTCQSDLNTEHFISLKETLLAKLNESEKVKKTILETNTELKKRKLELDNVSIRVNTSFDNLKREATIIKNRLNVIRVPIIDNSEDNLIEFEKNIEESKQSITLVSDRTTVLLQREKCYKELGEIFGVDGIKKTIISSIIDPLNTFVQENIRRMNLPFSVKIDASFDVTIMHMREEIDHDSISTGENRLINIAILIGYLKLIRVKHNINVLFLDEIFSSVDMSNVDILLQLFGDFAREYKMNIFVVHHSIVSEGLFDRIIRLEKNMFTSIIEEK